MTGGRRTFFLHIGTRKTGTTGLQISLSKSLDILLGQGVSMPFVDWADHRDALGDPLLLSLGDDARAEWARRALRAAAERCRAAEGDRLLASYEEFAELDERHIRALAELLEDFDVRIIVTARPWAATLPSEWQQSIKEHLVLETFPEYLEEIRDESGPEAVRFRRRHDVPGIVQRWGAVFGPDHIHVVLLPPQAADPGLLVRLFCGLIGVDPAALRAGPRTGNRSLSYAAAETLRRIHVVNRERLPDFITHFRSLEFRKFLRPSLEQASGPPAQVPVEYRAWCEEVAREHATVLQQSGCHIVGEIGDLTPTDWPPAVPPPDESEISEVAVSVAADLTLRLLNDLGDPREARPEPPRPPALRRAMAKARMRLRSLR